MSQTTKPTPNLVVMLTHNDLTVSNAEEIFNRCMNSKARFWGMKEEPLPLPRMKTLYAAMKKSGVGTVLEVVAYDEEAGMKGARMGAACGCDILMGTKFHRSIADFCSDNGIRYMPFVGSITGRPSRLFGSAEEMVEEALEAIEYGAWGVDLLGYRYVGDAAALNKTIVESISAPVCIAGSIDSFNRLDEVRQTAPWGFTIGSAFFNNRFGDDFASQIDAVIDHLGR